MISPHKLTFLLVAAATTSGAAAQTFPFSVGTSTNLYYVDTGDPGCSAIPIPVITLPPGLGRVMTLSDVTGTSNAGAGWPTVTADGGANICGGTPTDLTALRGISAIRHNSRCNFLGAVFIDGTPVAGAHPAGLVFSNETFTTLSPLLQQLFYVGDGRNSTGLTQSFNVPNSATRLVLGVPDGNCFRGTPGSYCDNVGRFEGNVVITTCLAPPTPPSSAIACGDQPATFTVEAAGAGPFTYQWQVETAPNTWLDLAGGDNPLPCGGSISATNPTSASAAFVLSPCAGGNSCVLRCVVSNACGSLASDEAVLVVHSADFNNDGDIGTDEDIESFFSCLAGACCPSCGTADFNGDGDTGADDDIEAFFRVLAGGSC